MNTKNSKPIVVSGMQPTGSLHLGNYLGALKNWVAIQNKEEYKCYFFIADYHSISENYDPKEKQKQILELAATYLAAGLDPEKSTIFVQSMVPQSTELAWIFNTLTPMAEMERMTQFKDKASRQKQNINMGLFDYPVLQASDILLYHGQHVPVGEDQVQHVELTRDIAGWFNKKYKTNYFPEAKPLLTPTPRIMSPADPTKKMSKSLGKKHWIGIAQEPADIKKKIMKWVTTDKGIDNLKTLYEQFKDDINGEFDQKNMKATKEAIANGIANHFTSFRATKKSAMADKKYLLSILKKGADKAMPVADKTLKEIKNIIGVSLSD